MSVNYNSGKNIFIGWGLPANPEKLDPTKYEGALIYDGSEQMIKYSTGSEWTEPINAPIRKPYALEPTNSSQQSQLRLSKFLTSAEFKDVYRQIAVVFEVYRDEAMLDPVRLPWQPSDESNEESWVIKLEYGTPYLSNTNPTPTGYGEYDPSNYINLLDNGNYEHTRNLYQLPKELFDPEQKFYWRAKYIANDGQESKYSDLYEQTYPSIIDTPYARTRSGIITDKVEISPFVSSFSKTYGQTRWEFYDTAPVNETPVGSSIFSLTTSLDENNKNYNPFRIDVLEDPDPNTFFSGNTYYWRAQHFDQDGDNSAWSIFSNVIIPETEVIKIIYDTRKTISGDAELVLVGTNMDIDWGDGTSNTGLNSAPNVGEKFFHNYNQDFRGEYLITISGDVKEFTFGDEPQETPVSPSSKAKLTKILSFGKKGTIQYFKVPGAINLEEVPNYLPSSITSCRSMFSGCTNFNRDLNLWDTKNIIDMQSMFQNANSFNGDISTWNTSNVGNINGTRVESFRNMFNGATSFNRNINFQEKQDYHGQGDNIIICWDTSKSPTMDNMFRNARSFNGDIRNWDISEKCSNTASMFEGAVSFNNDLSNWDFSKVTDMSNMFNNAFIFNRDIGTGDFSKVTNFSNMFANTNFSRDISHWQLNTDEDINMSGMFQGSSINLNIDTDVANGTWDVSRVTNMSSMFKNCTRFDKPLSNWNTSNVKTMNSMFYNAQQFNQPLETSDDIWNVSNVEDVSYMFCKTRKFNQPLTWNLSNATNLSYMFSDSWEFNSNTRFTLCVDTEKSVDLGSMFESARAFNKNINYNINSDGAWNTSRVNNINSMFKTATVFNQDLSDWDLSNITSTNGVFYYSTAFNQDLGNWSSYMSNVTNMDRMFRDAISFNNGGSDSIKNWNTSNVTSMSYIFYNASNFNQPIGSWDVSKVTSFSGIFRNASEFNQPLNNWNTANVTSFVETFQGATKFNQPLNNWKANNVINMSYMFQNANSFNQSIGNWNTSNVTNISYTFNNAPSFNQDLSNWNTSSANNMVWTFYNATSFNNGDPPKANTKPLTWNTSNVQSMYRLFYNSKFNQDISNWNTSKVKTMREMFANTEFNQPINTNGDNWNTSIVEDMYGMFYCPRKGVSQFNQDISDWDTGNVRSMTNMFARTIFNQDISDWDTKNVTNMFNMFLDSEFNQDISKWNVSLVGSMQNMFQGGKLSTENYDKILNINTGWPSRSVLKQVPFSAGKTKYTSANTEVSDGRLKLLSELWVITDGGKVET